MSNQIETHENCCKIPSTVCPCPVCGQTGRRVTVKTIDHHLPSSLRSDFGDEAAFCMNPKCEVVYCDLHGKIVRKGQTLLPVTIKETDDEVYVCYCFEYKRADIRKDLKLKGKTDIPEKIKKGIQDGKCDCERKNPQGSCCLGNVYNTIKTIQAELK